MKVLHALHGFLPEFRGGTEFYVKELARATRELGIEPTILCGSGRTRQEPVIEIEEIEGLRVFRLHRTESYPDRWDHGFSPQAERLLERLLDEERPDILHVHHWKRLSRNLVTVAAEARLPSVVTLHDLHVTCPQEFRIRDGELCTDPLPNPECHRCLAPHPWQERDEVERELRLHRDDFARELRLARCVLTPSPAHARMVATLLGRDVEDFQAELLGDLGALPAPPVEPHPEGKLRLAHWGHLDACKGSHLVVEALRSLTTDELDRIEVHLYGKAVTREFSLRLQELARGRPVFFHGAFEREELGGFAFEVAVIPSVASESYSYVLNEAFSLGRPVIASRRGALEDRVGEAGLLFEPGDAEDLARRIRELVSDPTLLRRITDAVPDRLPDMNDHARKIFAVYSRASMMGPPDLDLMPRGRRLSVLEQRCRQVEERAYDLLRREARIHELQKKGWLLEGEKLELAFALRAAQETITRIEQDSGRLRARIDSLEKAMREGLAGRLARVVSPRRGLGKREQEGDGSS